MENDITGALLQDLMTWKCMLITACMMLIEAICKGIQGVAGVEAGAEAVLEGGVQAGV